MYQIYATNDSMKLLGFTDQDIDNLNVVLESLNNLKLIEFIHYDPKCFDINEFVKLLVKDSSLRDAVVSSYYEINSNYFEELKSNLGLIASSYSFKWNLFLICLASLKNKDLYLGLDIYFNLFQNEPKMFNSYLDAGIEMFYLGVNDLTVLYNLISGSSTLERSGWIVQKIPTGHKESIAEHMYNMQLICDLYLTKDGEYNTKKIKTMCYIHDLGENVIGDICHPDKTSSDDNKEDLAIKGILLGMLFNNVKEAEDYLLLWEEWMLSVTLDGKIAHDIDCLQLNYQLYTYSSLYPEAFSDEELKLWSRRRPVTDVGKEIFKVLVENNPKFKDTLKRIL